MRKPVVGLMPRYLYEEIAAEHNAKDKLNLDLLRLIKIREAIARYEEVGKKIPVEWYMEIQDTVTFKMYASSNQN